MRSRDKKNVVNDELYICTCHQLAPGVGPWANQGKNDGFSRGWVGLSALRDGPLEKLLAWGGGGGGGIFEPQEFLFLGRSTNIF